MIFLQLYADLSYVLWPSPWDSTVGGNNFLIPLFDKHGVFRDFISPSALRPPKRFLGYKRIGLKRKYLHYYYNNSSEHLIYLCLIPGELKDVKSRYSLLLKVGTVSFGRFYVRAMENGGIVQVALGIFSNRASAEATQNTLRRLLDRSLRSVFGRVLLGLPPLESFTRKGLKMFFGYEDYRGAYGVILDVISNYDSTIRRVVKEHSGELLEEWGYPDTLFVRFRGVSVPEDFIIHNGRSLGSFILRRAVTLRGPFLFVETDGLEGHFLDGKYVVFDLRGKKDNRLFPAFSVGDVK